MRFALRAVALLAAVMVAAILLAAALVRLPAIERWVGAQVAARLPEGASVERASLTLLPPAVALRNVSLAADGPALAAVACRLRIAPLLAGRLEIASVVVDGASLGVVRDAAGELHVAGALSGLLAAADPGGAERVPLFDALPALTVQNAGVAFVDQMARGGARTLRLDALRLTLAAAGGRALAFSVAGQLEPAGRIGGSGSVREVAGAHGQPTDRALDATFEASGLDANTIVSYLAALVPGGGTARAQGGIDGSLTLSGSTANLSGAVSITQPSGSLLWDEVSLAAPLTLTARFAATGGAVALTDGKLHVAHLAAARIAASDVAVDFAVDHDTLRIASARASAYGGTWSQAGTVSLSEPPRYDVRMHAEDVQCEALLSAVTGERPEYGCDSFSIDAALRGAWTGAETVAENAAGTGRIEMRGGTIPSSSIIAAMWRAIVPLLPVRGEPTRLGAATRVERLTQSFTLRAGRLDTDDLLLVTDDYTVTGRGTVSLGGALNLDTEVALTPSGVAKLLIMAELPVPSDVPDLPAIPTRIGGTLGSPIILPAATRIPAAALRGALKSLRGAGSALTGTADKGLRSLRRELGKVW